MIKILAAILLIREVKHLKANGTETKTEKEEINVTANLENQIIITLSREYGSGGRYIGKLVAEKMKKDNLPIFLIMTVIAIVLVKLVGVIPYVGGLLSFLITMTGFGMILVHLIKIGDKKIKTETNSAVENK